MKKILPGICRGWQRHSAYDVATGVKRSSSVSWICWITNVNATDSFAPIVSANATVIG
jgi:hypothetical protein